MPHAKIPDLYALSIKQPWAALLVHGLKTIEVRRWPTARRGPILIHAAKISDPREEVWSQLPDIVKDTSRLLGGIIGKGELTGCISYRSKEAFSVDQERHHNKPDWFMPPLLFGFTFTNLVQLPFRPFSGWMRFFQVPAEVILPAGGK